MLVAYDAALDLIRALRPMIAQLRGTAPRPPTRSSALRVASCSTSLKAIAVMAAIREGSST
jgi:hypothetical protein